LHRLEAVIDHETAALSFQSLARAYQLLALPVNSPRAFLLFAGHCHSYVEMNTEAGKYEWHVTDSRHAFLVFSPSKGKKQV
jgi:hypothetical protein